MDRGGSPQEALRREVREEVGLEVKVEALLAIKPGDDPRQLQFGYLCRLRRREQAALGTFTHLSREILSARWVSPAPDDLPDPIPPFHQALIARAVERERRGGWQGD
jgi:8-oxo-dGTP pyrophosphatase MutT (NUDIX family)